MTNVAPNMNISGLDSKRNKRPKVRFDEDVLGIGEQEDIDFAVEKAKVSLFAEDIFNEEKKQEDIDCAVEKAKNSFFEEVILKEEKKRKSKKKKKKKKKSKHKDRDSLSDRTDDAAGQDFFFHQREFNVENHIPSSNLRESKGDLNLENNNGPVQIPQQEEGREQRYSVEISSKISQLRLKMKMMEKDRESLRARNLGNEAQEIIDVETFEESPNIKETHTLLTTGNDAELKTSGENNEPIPSLPLGLTGKAESSQESLNEKHESDTVRMLSISERKCTSDYSSDEEKCTPKSKANELKKPPPTSFQLERDNSQRLGLSAAEIIDASRDSGQDKDETKPGAVQVASPAPRVKPDERVGAFNFSPLCTENSSPYLCDSMADEKVRVAASLESYEANADAGGLSTKINTSVLSFGSSSDSAATISPGAFAVAGGGLSSEKNANVSFGPSVDSAAENYESIPQLSLAYASPEDVVKLQNSKALAGFSSLGHISAEDDKVPTITAFEVNEDDIENVTKRESVIRQQIISESVEAVEVVNDTKARRKKRCLVIFFLLSVAGIVLGLSLGLTGDEKYVIVTTAPSVMPSSSPTETILPTLGNVVLQGKLRCGVYGDSTGFSKINNKTGVREGIDADLCRAVAAAVFDDPGRVEFVQMRSSWRFPSLANRSIDLLAAIATHTMERDVNEKSTQTGFTFTVPYLYDGLGFGGDPKWVDCADRLDYHHMNGCRELRICVDSDSSHEFKLRSELFPDSVIISTATNKEVLENIISGMCNVVAGESAFLSHFGDMRLETANYTGEYVIGNNMFSKEPLALVTRQDDPLWSGFVNHVLQALMAAERENITQSSAESFYNTTLFGDEYESMFINAIKAVGNFAELHDRNLKGVIPRDGLNLLNTKGDTGLIYSSPFGEMLVEGAGPTRGGTLEKIVSRGHLICGISLRTGFGEYNPANKTWNGLDADFCRALVAGIFVDYSDSNVVFTELNETSARFNMHADGGIDVFAGGSHTLSTDILEPTTGEGFTFTKPYFYESRQANETEDKTSMNAEDRNLNFKVFSLVTREDDPQWSDFVNWIVESIFYAEERHISKFEYVGMPRKVLLFGPEFGRMMQTAIKAVGNYGEMYARSVEKVFPRNNTRNMQNTVAPFGPQISPLI
eukprot:CAMPEP_0194210154 /NCGR_PEP_ID=MMETSP0156-20130528/8050_1 /TAXON_ID=33649 /ORGANISM="Thalassionema nitzschioides, Strain L26-B" /LENGTH=1146 /DNA_ID=CAMNT_0038937467 /DNA_START=37 /DNA_END=3477 /DNA_ORIENTATION=-